MTQLLSLILSGFIMFGGCHGSLGSEYDLSHYGTIIDMASQQGNAQMLVTFPQNEPVEKKDEWSLSKLKNNCGFLCGRCQFCYVSDDSKAEPQHDCFSIPRYGIPRMCRTPEIDISEESGVSECNRSHWGLYCGVSWIAGICGFSSLRLLYCCLGGNPSNLCVFSPCIAIMGVDALVLGHAGVGYCARGCADAMNDEAFVEHYDRGTICWSEDRCSCTSLRRMVCCGTKKENGKT